MRPLHNLFGLSGLTRNEVLALAALGILALAVALPYFLHQARAAARSASLQNLRQWGIALNLYLVENDHTLPASGHLREDPAAWFEGLPPYLSLPPLSQTPPAAVHGDSLWAYPGVKLPNGTSGSASRVTYGYNIWLQPESARPPWRIYEIEDPSATLFLVETGPGTLLAQPSDMAFPHDKSRTGLALFCDGHVEAVTREAALQPAAADPAAHPAARPTWIPFYQAPPPRP